MPSFAGTTWAVRALLSEYLANLAFKTAPLDYSPSFASAVVHTTLEKVTAKQTRARYRSHVEATVKKLRLTQTLNLTAQFTPEACGALAEALECMARELDGVSQ